MKWVSMAEVYMHRRTGLRTLGLIYLMGFSAISCQLEHAGSLKLSPEVVVAFETQRVPAAYSYYFLNQVNNPFGVVGLKKGYWMEGPEWTGVDPSSETFRKVVELVKRFPAPGGRTEGFYILDPKGEPIGFWYSSLTAGVTVDPDTKRVMLSTPTPWMQN
jgi:hypothetical protein